MTLGSARTVASLAIGGTGTLHVNLPGSLAVTDGLALAGTLSGSGTVTVAGDQLHRGAVQALEGDAVTVKATLSTASARCRCRSEPP